MIIITILSLIGCRTVEITTKIQYDRKVKVIDRKVKENKNRKTDICINQKDKSYENRWNSKCNK